MIKRIFAGILLLASVAQCFGQGLVLFQFYTHQSYIAKNLCVNRNKPQLKCNGHCLLSKKLKAEDKKEQNNSGGRLEARFELSYFLPNFFQEFNNPAEAIVLRTTKKVFLPLTTRDPFFHPPCFAV